MIKGLHAMFYSPKADEVREFLRDKFEFPATDVGEGWLIMDPPAADIGAHPSDDSHHELSFWCDDIEKTRRVLEERGVEFTQPVSDHGWGLVTFFKLPDDSEIQLYEPKYKK